MSDLFGQFLMVMLGAVLSAAGFMLKRRIEGRGTFDAVDKHERLLSLRDKLLASGTTVEDLNIFESSLLGRAESAAKVVTEYEHLAIEAIGQGTDHDLTQTDMNILAGEAARRADERLKRVVEELEGFCSSEEVTALHETQAAWNRYREKHVKFCGEQYRGGSIQPMIHNIAFESVTISRIVELESELQELNRLSEPSK